MVGEVSSATGTAAVGSTSIQYGMSVAVSVYLESSMCPRVCPGACPRCLESVGAENVNLKTLSSVSLSRQKAALTGTSSWGRQSSPLCETDAVYFPVTEDRLV